MKITVESLIRAVEMWINNDLLSQSNTLQQAIITFFVLQSKSNLIKNLKPYLSLITDDKGKFDFTILSDSLSKTIDKIGGAYVIPGINYRFDKADVTKILEYCKGYLTND